MSCSNLMGLLLACWPLVVWAGNRDNNFKVEAQEQLKFEQRTDYYEKFREWFALDEEENRLERELERYSVPRDCGPKPQFAYGGCIGFAAAMGIDIGNRCRKRHTTCMNLIGAQDGIGPIDLAEAKRRFEREGNRGYKRIIGEQIRVRQAEEDWYACLGREESRPDLIKLQKYIEKLKEKKKQLDDEISEALNDEGKDEGAEYEDAEWYSEDGFDFIITE